LQLAACSLQLAACSSQLAGVGLLVAIPIGNRLVRIHHELSKVVGRLLLMVWGVIWMPVLGLRLLLTVLTSVAFLSMMLMLMLMLLLLLTPLLLLLPNHPTFGHAVLQLI
jgi:hypothetical protein